MNRRFEPSARSAARPCTGVALCCVLASAAIQAPAHADSAGIFDPKPLTTTDGQQIFEHICQGCHMSDARGAVGAGHFPALAKDSTLSSRQYMAITILMGRRNMPAFGARHAIGFGSPPATLNETQIAAVINYVRTHFGNRYTDAITPQEVASLDQKPRSSD
jgi:mono/diheme cytochrome c family protein